MGIFVTSESRGRQTITNEMLPRLVSLRITPISTQSVVPIWIKIGPRIRTHWDIDSPRLNTIGQEHPVDHSVAQLLIKRRRRRPRTQRQARRRVCFQYSENKQYRT